MAQNQLRVKILSSLTKYSSSYNGLWCSEQKYLHNAASTTGADSLSRVHGKLRGSDVRRMGPTTAVLEAVSGGRPAKDTLVAGPPTDKAPTVIMDDPNGTMWQLCMEKETPIKKKVGDKIRTMKDNIREYYIVRWQQGKRPPDQPKPVPVEQPIVEAPAPKPTQKETLLSLLQMKRSAPQSQSVMRREIEEEAKLEEARLRLQENNAEDCATEGRSRRMFRNYAMDSNRSQGGRLHAKQARADKEALPEPDLKKENVWLSDKSNIEAQKDGAAGEPRLKPNLFNYKSEAPLPYKPGNILESLRKEDLLMSRQLFNKRASDSRFFSTLLQRSPRVPLKPKKIVTFTEHKFSVYKPAPGLLQRQVADNLSGTKERVSNGYIRGRFLSTCSTLNNTDPCVPKPLAPKNCTDPNKGPTLPKCPRPPPVSWPPCCKISLCGCYPPHERIYQPNCGKGAQYSLSVGKKPEYKCPSFSECCKITELNKKKPSDCSCFGNVIPCSKDQIGAKMKKPFIFAVERMEQSLGQKYWSKGCGVGYHTAAGGTRGFHTSRRLNAEGEEQCDKKKGQLPCLKTVNIPGIRKKEYKGKGSCERTCMPCCAPARDPPECFSVYTKPPCTKFKNPRPAFSECRKMFPMRFSKCECEVNKKPICGDKSKKEKETC